MFARVMFGVHPSSRTSLTVPVLDKVTRADLSAHHKSRFVPDHALIAFAGDITMAEARKLVDARFGAWKKGNVPVPSVPDPPLPGPAKIYFIARPNSVQTN